MVRFTLGEYVARLVDQAPPVDDAQRDVILAAFAGLTPASRRREAA